MSTLSFDGREVPVRPGQTVAGALWAAGIRSWRTTRVAGRPRGLFCGIGACFDCLATIDRAPNRRACLVPARPGQTVTSAGSEPVARPEPAPAAVGAARRFDVAVVGGGPAGLAAAASAALAGCRVALVDAAERLGGQFWRHAEGSTGQGQRHRDWSSFTGLRSLVEERVEHLAGASVWFVEPGFVLHTSAGPVEADRLVLATGAYDRALPFPGWDLPGVVTPGAAQALLKGSGVPVGQRVVVAGAGPFLLPVAVGLLDAGVSVVGVYEAGDPRGYLRRPGALAAAVAKVGEAAGYAAALARRRVPYRTRRAVVAAHGDGAVSEVDIARLDRSGRPTSTERVACDAVAVGYGFTANLELALALGCRTVPAPDGGLAVGVGEDGRTSVSGVFAAGEVTGVGGASLAVVEGLLAGSAVAASVGAEPLPARDVTSLRRRQDRLRTFAEAMHATHAPPAGWPSWLADDTLVCRCEEVPHAAVVRAVELGGIDARTVKSLARPGMGWCQGRVCGYATAELTARSCGRAVTGADLAAFAARPFATPVPLGDLAADA
jgi:D-hydroxyproline dehydrogenase subunit alpha